MDDIAGTLLTAFGAFVSTNLDDLMVLGILFLSNRAAARPRKWKIWVGQYLGIGILVVVSLLAGLALAAVPTSVVGLLGLVPIVLGVRGLIAGKDDDGGSSAPVISVTTVATMTIANGGDNISVYVPLFKAQGTDASVLTIVAFAVLVAVWCIAASWLTSHRVAMGFVRRFGHWVIPVLFIAVGTVIILKSGVLTLL